MMFQPKLCEGILLKRYKRFLADVRLFDGQEITAHCPNTGAMIGLTDPGTKIWLAYHEHAKRKYPYSWEMIEENKIFIGTNTHTPNKLVREAFSKKSIPFLKEYDTLQAEVTAEHSRLDFCFSGPNGLAYVEIKNVHWKRQQKNQWVAAFPDTVTTRGARHLRDLESLGKKGIRAIMLYVIQRNDCDGLCIADDVDPDYALAFSQAEHVEFYAVTCRLSIESITLDRWVPVLS